MSREKGLPWSLADHPIPLSLTIIITSILAMFLVGLRELLAGVLLVIVGSQFERLRERLEGRRASASQSAKGPEERRGGESLDSEPAQSPP